MRKKRKIYETDRAVHKRAALFARISRVRRYTEYVPCLHEHM